MAPIAARSDNSEDATLAVSAVVIVLAVISVALRFYTRKVTQSGLGADDWLIMAAVVATLATAALLLWGRSNFGSVLPTNAIVTIGYSFAS